MSSSRARRTRTNTAIDHQAQLLVELAGRLTDRDRQVCRLVWDHRVLTAPQLTRLAFPSRNRAEVRLTQLYAVDLLERFRPRRDTGSAPYHYVLGGIGAAVLATEQGIDVHQLGWRRDKALSVAVNQRLGHIVGVNEFFTQLAGYARHRRRDAALVEWWPERRCRQVWGPIVHPDGFGRWRQHDTELDFFLEYDNATEPTDRVAAKLTGYARLGRANHLLTPLLFWLPTPGREATIRRALGATSDAAHVLIATTYPQPNRTPADAVWLPLGQQYPRCRLIELADPVTWRPRRPI